MRSHWAGALLAALLLAPAGSRAELPATIRIGVLNDMSGGCPAAMRAGATP